MLWIKRYFFSISRIEVGFLIIYYFFLKIGKFLNPLIIRFFKKYYEFLFFLNLKGRLKTNISKNFKILSKRIWHLVNCLNKLLNKPEFKSFAYANSIIFSFEVILQEIKILIELWKNYKKPFEDDFINPYSILFTKGIFLDKPIKKFTWSFKKSLENSIKSFNWQIGEVEKEMMIAKESELENLASRIKRLQRRIEGTEEMIEIIEINSKIQKEKIKEKTLEEEKEKIKEKNLEEEKDAKLKEVFTELAEIVKNRQWERKVIKKKKGLKERIRILNKIYCFSLKQIKQALKKFVWTKSKKNFIIFILIIKFFLDFVQMKEEKLVQLSDKFWLIALDLKVILYYIKFFYEEIKNFKIYNLMNMVSLFKNFFINFYNFTCISENELLDNIFEEVFFRIYEIFFFKPLLLEIDENIFFYKKERGEHLIISKSAFQIKLDLNTFFFLGIYFAFYRNFVYNRYIIRHFYLCLKLLNKKYYINSKDKLYKKEDLLKWDYVKTLLENNFILISFKSVDVTFLGLYDPQVYFSSVKQSFFKSTINYPKSKFWHFLGFYLKKRFSIFVHYISYKKLMLNLNSFVIYFWFFFHYTDIFKKIFSYWEDDLTLIKFLNTEYKRNILNLCLPKKPLIDNYLIKDFLIFLKPSYSYKFFLYEAEFFMKILKYIVYDFILENIFFFDFENNLILLKGVLEELTEKKLQKIYKNLIKHFFYKYFLESVFAFMIYDFNIEVIDFFLLYVYNIINYNVKVSAYDLIDYSRFVSQIVYFNKVYAQFYDMDILRLNFFILFYCYRDLILSLVDLSAELQILLFFIKKGKNCNFTFIRYFYNKEKVKSKTFNE